MQGIDRGQCVIRNMC